MLRWNVSDILRDNYLKYMTREIENLESPNMELHSIMKRAQSPVGNRQDSQATKRMRLLHDCVSRALEWTEELDRLRLPLSENLKWVGAKLIRDNYTIVLGVDIRQTCGDDGRFNVVAILGGPNDEEIRQSNSRFQYIEHDELLYYTSNEICHLMMLLETPSDLSSDDASRNT